MQFRYKKEQDNTIGKKDNLDNRVLVRWKHLKIRNANIWGFRGGQKWLYV